MNWSDQESCDYLTWNLEGKALDIANKMDDYSYRQIMKNTKLDSWFGSIELAETLRANFSGL